MAINKYDCCLHVEFDYFFQNHSEWNGKEFYISSVTLAFDNFSKYPLLRFKFLSSFTNKNG